MLSLSYYAYVFSSKKLEIRENRFCLEARGVGWRGSVQGEGERNGPNNVCTCELMNIKLKRKSVEL
jgi:hypothetical protein